MSKTVTFKSVKPVTADDWVSGTAESPAVPVARSAPVPTAPEAMKRFTIDVPTELHTRIKTECARRGVKMADVLRQLLEREFPGARGRISD